MSFAIAFTLGAIILQCSAALPLKWQAGTVLAGGLACWVLGRALPTATDTGASTGAGGARRTLRLATVVLAAFALGYGWSAWRAIERFSNWLDPRLETADIELEGTVVDLPQPFDGGVRLALEAEGVRPVGPPAADPLRAPAADPVRAPAPAPAPVHAPVQGLVLLTWYRAGERDAPAATQVRGGERWRFAARLRRPHGNANPLVFDYEASLLERGVVATGTVRNSPAPQRLAAWDASPGGLLARLRQEIRDHLWRALGDAPYRGIIAALAIGDQQAVSNDLWREFNRTGISHLMSISGLHVTMFGALAAALASFLWRRIPGMPLVMPAQKVAALAGMCGAALYCALAGFGVPAQRTLYMLAIAALSLLFDRWHSAASVLAAALVVVIAIDPWAPLTAGFWLSFCAVGVLFYGAAGPPGASKLDGWIRAQAAVTVGLAPLTLAIFKQVSLVGPLVNAVAIPLVSLVITPLSLVAAVAPYDGFARLAHAVLATTMPWLHRLAALPYAVWAQHSPPGWTVGLACLGVGWMLAPRGTPGRWTGLTMMAPMFFLAPASPATGQVSVEVLDVGQGLAVVIRTRNHTTVYDPGPRYGPEADAGDRVVVPYLQAIGVRGIDRLIVTHQDADHSGGTRSVLGAMPTAILYSSLDAAHTAGLTGPPGPVKVPCYAGQAWQEDAVRFEFLHPALEDYDHPSRRTNSMSCVLRISAGKHALLLTADIEAKEEARLAARLGGALHADLLLVPHHGSRTSSTAIFLDAVNPRVAVISAGYHNRFGHPRPEILERYEARGIKLFRTDRSGAVMIELAPGGLTVREFRQLEPRYYRRVPEA